MSFASLLRFWAVAASRNSSRAPLGPRSRNRRSRRIRLRCANSISMRLRSLFDCSNTGVPVRARATSRARLVYASRNLASRRVGTTPVLVFTWTAIEGAASVKQRRLVVHERAGRCQHLAGRTNVDIGGLIETEVVTREGPIASPGSVEDRNVRGNALLRGQPVQGGSRTIGAVGR